MNYSEYCYVGAEFDHPKANITHKMVIEKIDTSRRPHYYVVYTHSENNDKIDTTWDFFEKWIDQKIIFPIVSIKSIAKNTALNFIYERSFAVPKNKEVPEWLLNQAIDAGESWVRRNTRSWPYCKVLMHKISRSASNESSREETVTVQWYWENSNES